MIYAVLASAAFLLVAVIAGLLYGNRRELETSESMGAAINDARRKESIANEIAARYLSVLASIGSNEDACADELRRIANEASNDLGAEVRLHVAKDLLQ